MTKKQVLVISNPYDEHTRNVVQKIEQLGVNPILLYPENFGENLFLELSQNPNRSIFTHLELAIDSLQSGFSFYDFYSIWYRRPRLPQIMGKDLTPESKEFAQDEWQFAIEAVYALLKNQLWVSHPDKLRKASRKPLQLLIAHQIGLKTPDTLITNNPQKAKQFYNFHNGKIICKATGRGWVYPQNEEEVYFVLTNRLSANDIEAYDEISIAPTTFQEEIPKAYEIRVNVVGQQVLAVQIDSQKSKVSEVDWRRYDVSNTPYNPYQLPNEIEKKCLRLTQLLGLEFGAIDLIRQPNGDYIFLEINGNGQFLWAEELSGSQISLALAQLLSGVSPPLKLLTL